MSFRRFLACLALSLLPAATAMGFGARHFKSGPIQISADGRWVWVVNPDNDSVSRIDTSTDAVSEFVLPDPATRDKPLGLSLREDGSEVWVACHDSDRVYVLDGASGNVRSRVDLPWGSGPYSVALSRDQSRALVTLHRSDGLAMIDVTTRRLAAVLAPVYQAPLGIAWMEDGVSAWITHMGSGLDEIYLSRVDVAGARPLVTSKILTFPAPPQSSTSLTDPDPTKNIAEGGYLLIRGHLAELPTVAGRNEFWLPTEYHNVHEQVFASPPSSVNQSSIRHFDLTKKALLTDLVLDKVVVTALHVHGNSNNWVGHGWDAEVAGPVDIAFSADAQVAYLLHEQSDDLLVVPTDTPAFKPAPATPELTEIAVGAHPMGLALSPVADVAYVSNRLGSASGSPAGRTVSVVDLVGRSELRQIVVAAEPYSPSKLSGARIFNSSADPRIAAKSKIACATCHPGGEQDRRIWDLNHTPGLHGPRYTQSLLGIARTFAPGQRDPVHGWGQLHLSGDRDEVQDFEHTFQGVTMGGQGFLGPAVNPELGPPNAGRNPELDALAEYVISLEPLARSPHRASDGSLSEAAERGATFFLGSDPAKPADAVCAGCHDPSTAFLDHQFHDVGQLRFGSERELNARNPPWHVNTPSLVGAFATPPYEGFSSFPSFTMVGTLKDFVPRADHGTLGRLTRRQLADLAEFVLSIDGDLRAADTLAARDRTAPRVVRAEVTSLTAIDVWFNESIDPVSASDVANWILLESGTTPIAITGATFDPQNGDRVRLTTSLRAGCVSYTLLPGAILDLADSATGGVANALDPNDPRNQYVLTIGNTLTITLGGSGYENITIPVHDAGTFGGTWTFDYPYLTPPANVHGKAFVRFDWRDTFAAVSGISAASDIVEARFSIEPDSGDANLIEARRVLLPWSDVHNGRTRMPAGGVTWNNHIAPSSPWNIAGAKKTTVGVDGSSVGHYNGLNDVSDVIDATTTMAAINERLVVAGAGVTAAFRFWFDNRAVDYGYTLALASGSVVETSFHGSEEDLNDHGPVLTITYQVGAAALPAPPGEVSGRGSATPLYAVKRGAGVLLSFADLGPGADSYNVYEGAIGNFYSHSGGLGCNRPASPAGVRRELLYAAAENSYFVVTASNCAAEGPSDLDHPAARLDCAP